MRFLEEKRKNNQIYSKELETRVTYIFIFGRILWKVLQIQVFYFTPWLYL